MVSYSKRLAQRDADERAKKKAAGGTFVPQPMSRRVNPQTTRVPCPQCNSGRSMIPKFARTTKVSPGGCANCGGDRYLDPGDRGYRKR